MMRADTLTLIMSRSDSGHQAEATVRRFRTVTSQESIEGHHPSRPHAHASSDDRPALSAFALNEPQETTSDGDCLATHPGSCQHSVMRSKVPLVGTGSAHPLQVASLETSRKSNENWYGRVLTSAAVWRSSHERAITLAFPFIFANHIHNATCYLMVPQPLLHSRGEPRSWE